MPLHTNMIGQAGTAATDLVEDRWTMNYAAAVYDTNPVYYANQHGGILPMHPAYVSHLEWDAIGLLHKELGERMDARELLRGVHSYNQTSLHDTFRAGEVLSCTASVVGVERRRSGGRLTIKTVTTSDHRAVATSYTSTVFRGIEVEGGGDVLPDIPRHPSPGPPERQATPSRVDEIRFTRLAPYHFTECARDYGPIHTNPKAAADAGLPGVIMHGTATIAYALSNIVNHEAEEVPVRMTGFEAKLAAMVLCPSTCMLQVYSDFRDNGLVRFELLNENNDKAISHGIACLASA